MLITALACFFCLTASFASAARHIVSSPADTTWQTMGPFFRGVTFAFSMVTLFLGLRLFFAAIDGVEKIPPDASYGYVVLAGAVAVDRVSALWRIKRERKQWALGQLNASGFGLGSFDGTGAPPRP